MTIETLPCQIFLDFFSQEVFDIPTRNLDIIKEAILERGMEVMLPGFFLSSGRFVECSKEKETFLFSPSERDEGDGKGVSSGWGQGRGEGTIIGGGNRENGWGSGKGVSWGENFWGLRAIHIRGAPSFLEEKGKRIYELI